MGRTLPWKKQGAGTGPRARTATAAGTTASNARNTFTQNNDHVTSSPRESPPPSSSPFATTPSLRSKTPPIPSRNEASHDASGHGFGDAKPLPERFMIPGLQHDDKWRMVEDEFVAMAHKFTAHLHAAEYQRLKKMAKDQNADAIRSLSRPVTGPMTDRVRRRQAVLSLKKSQNTSIKKARSRALDADENDDLDVLPWAGTNLEGLMDSPRKKSVPLTRMVSKASGTRAAALSRKDSGSSPKSILQTDSVQQECSPSTTRKRSVRFQQAQSEDERDSDNGSASCRSTNNIDVPSSLGSIPARAASSASGRVGKAPSTVAVSASAPGASNFDDDSDSPVETMFGQHFRERRNKKRIKSSTPDLVKEENQPSEKPPKNGSVKSSLSIPSF